MSQQQNRPRTVLVVDDDAVIRTMMAEIMDFEGYPTRLARNGMEALEFLRGEDSYVVFLDVMMPGMDGIQLCQILEGEPQVRNRHIIILMSALDTLTDIPAALDINATMPKPFTVDDVFNIIGPYMQ